MRDSEWSHYFDLMLMKISS